MKRFLTLGECMVELAPAGDQLYHQGFAGDTFNTAYYARRLLPQDWTVGYCSAVGQDAVSDDMLDLMRGHGIDISGVRKVADRTLGLYMIQLINGERSFSYWRGQSAAKLLADDPDWLETQLDGASMAQFSGITLAILSPEGREAFCAALARARANGTHVAFDTNLRPRLWEDEATMRAGLRMGAEVSDTVLPSFDEEEGLFGDATPADTIARYRDCGASTIAVKDGAGTLTIWDKTEGTQEFQPVKIDPVIDTTAAGDSFGAGFLAGLAMERGIAASAHLAMAVAAQVVQARGALVDLDMTDIEGAQA
ncbi:sugar kinase [Primorskyibacter marinus]|uniref:sugar kinase n=1 Tax=Primorskyibacter marinus TaxID=1977320 RepID=UPI000E30917A|nr:sugar kinase [Primorskyibacter marinus]